jgi:hypothetical protein
VSENRALRRISGPKKDEVTGEWRKLLHESFVICTHSVLSGDQIERNEMGRAYDTFGGEVYTGFWLET